MPAMGTVFTLSVRAACVVMAVLLLVLAPRLGAQGSGPPAPTPVAGTLRGIVTDTLGAPLADVDVVITELRRQSRTRRDGTFQFDSVDAGTYNVSARRVGYVVRAYRVNVTQDGGSVAIRMISVGVLLPSVLTVADPGGVSGVIADTAYKALRDVEVTVLGTGKSARTDSAGAFFIPLKPGEYMLRLERDGFVRQIKAVMIPESEGRKIAAWLVPRSGPTNNRQGQALFDLSQRMMRSSPVSTQYLSNEALTKQGMHDMADVARHWAVGSIAADCEVAIGGEPGVKIPLSLLTVSEVEFVEVYLPSNTAGGGSRGVTSMNGNTTKFTTPTSGRPGGSRACGNLALIVWLKP